MCENGRLYMSGKNNLWYSGSDILLYAKIERILFYVTGIQFIFCSISHGFDLSKL